MIELLKIYIECFQELIRLFVKSEKYLAKKENRAPVLSCESFHKWAAVNLRSPRSIWLYFMCISTGCFLIILRAAIRLDLNMLSTDKDLSAPDKTMCR